MAVFALKESLKIDFTYILSDRKIIKFPHCAPSNFDFVQRAAAHQHHVDSNQFAKRMRSAPPQTLRSLLVFILN